MSDVISCPTCGGPARASRTPTHRAPGEPTLIAVTDAAKSEKIEQLKRAVHSQKERLDAANQRIRELEETFRRSSPPPDL